MCVLRIVCIIRQFLNLCIEPSLLAHLKLNHCSNVGSLQMLHKIIDTFSANESSAVLEILKEEGCRMIVKVDDWSQGDCAIQ